MNLKDEEQNYTSGEQHKRKQKSESELHSNELSSPYAINPLIYKLEQSLNQIAKSKKKRNQIEGKYQIHLSQTVDIDIERQPYYYPKQNKLSGMLEPIPERPTQKYISSQNIEQYRKDQRFHKYSLCISRDVDKSKSPLDYEDEQQQIKSGIFPSLLKEEMNIKYITNYGRSNQINTSPQKSQISKIDVEKKDNMMNKVIQQKQERSDQSQDLKIKLFPSIKKEQQQQQQFFDQNPQDAQSERQPIEEKKLKFEPIIQKTQKRNINNGVQSEYEETIQELDQNIDCNQKQNKNRAQRFNLIMNYKYDKVMNEIQNMVKNFRKKQQKINNNKSKQVSFMI